MAVCAYCRAELESEATVCSACGRARLSQAPSDSDAPVPARHPVEAASRERAGSIPALDDGSPLLEARDLPGWLRSLEARPPASSQSAERRARDDVGSWIVDEAPADTSSESVLGSNPADSWLRPSAVPRQALSPAEAVFATAGPVHGGIQPLATSEPIARRAAGGPANGDLGASRRLQPGRPAVSSGASLRVATIVLIVAIVVFLAALAFFIVTMARA